jgi:hypothetical protein
MKLIPNSKVTHSEMARLKKQAFERKKIEEVANKEQKKDIYNKRMKDSEAQVLQDMKSSAISVNKGSVRIHGKEMNIADVDMRKLTRDSQRDIDSLKALESKIANLENLTLQNVEDIDNQFSMRPSLMSDNSQNRALHNLQYEIDKYQNEIKLLKLKLQFKHQLINYKQMEKQRNVRDPQTVNYQKDTCNIF